MTARDRGGQLVPVGPIREHVPGAPRQPGDLVRVEAILDSTADVALVGAVGRVVHLEYGCGCGQRYPDDPMIGVELPGGVVEEFWRDELATAGDAIRPRRTLGGWHRPSMALLAGIPSLAFDVTLPGRMWTHPIGTYAEASS